MKKEVNIVSLLFDAIILYVEDNYPGWSARYIVDNIHIVNRQLRCIIIINIDSMKGKFVIEPPDCVPVQKFNTIKIFQCTDGDLLQNVSEQIEIIKTIVASRDQDRLFDTDCEQV